MSDDHIPIAGPHPARAEPEQLDDLWLALEEGRLEDALQMAETLAVDYPEDGDSALARAAAYYEAGFPRDTLNEAERAGHLGTTDNLLQRWYVAAAHFYLWRFEQAREILDTLIREEDEFGEAWYLLAQVSEMQGDEVGARRGYQHAFKVAPERFHRPTRIDDETLDQALGDATADLPSTFQKALAEVAVVVRDVPGHEMSREESGAGDPLPPDLLGLFVGADRADKSVFNPVDQIGIIFLFKKNLERVCSDLEMLTQEIRTTLWHELAHYLGFAEEDMADLGLE